MSEIEDVFEIHRERYRVISEPPLLRIEQRVIGSDYGANSYTTRSQADRLSAMVGMSAGKAYLDVGSGAGWPALHMAASTGARVFLTDIPWEGLLIATRRISEDRIDAHVVAASGADLPFRDMSFDGVTSSDVFC